MPFKSAKLTILAFLAVLSGCGGPSAIIEQPSTITEYSSQEYTIGVGDVISVSVWRNEELSVQLPVRPDGKISLPLLGDVLAAGSTPEDLADSITVSLKNYIRTPQVTVLVTSPNSTDFLQRVRVTGAVMTPTSIPFRKGMTVLDLILLAGGVNDFASPNNTKLYRKVSGTTKVYPIYLDDILNKGKLDTNYPLSPSDVITVPERSF